MNPETNPKTEQQQNLCKQGCGFYGSTSFDGMCSKCFNEYQRRKKSDNNTKSTNSPKSSNIITSIAKDINNGLSPDGISSTIFYGSNAGSLNSTISIEDQNHMNDSIISPSTIVSESIDEAIPIKKNKCFKCNKKIGLTGFECRCGNFFCRLHRYSDQHQCEFDYKAAAKEHLSKSNPAINANKINKI